MKHRILTAVLSLLVAAMAHAATTEVRTNLWQGTQEVSDSWSGAQQVSSELLSAIAAGDEIVVTVSAISQTADWPQVSLRKTEGWAQFDPAVGVLLSKDSEVPYEARMTVDDAVAAELKANGFVVTGCGFTMTSIDLVQQRELAEGEKGNPVHNVWSGQKLIDWSGAVADAWLAVDASLFAKAQTGWIIRLNHGAPAIGAQGHISTGAWTDMPDATDYVQLTASYFEFVITDAMLAELQSGGCVVSGIGFTLTSIDLIDPTQIPLMNCTLAADAVNCWQSGDQPHISVTLQNLEANEMSTTVRLLLRTDNHADYASDSRELTIGAGETATATFDLELKPGFYHAVVEANHSLLRDFNIGYDPTAMNVATDMQPDFGEFWAKAKADLAAVEPEYKLTKLDDKSTDKRNVYLVEMKSIDNGDGQPVTIRGYYAEPTAAGTYPVVITQNGYDSDPSAEPWCPDADSNPEWIELVMSNRGQAINNRDPYKDENSFYGDWFAYNFGTKDTYYYRGAYMDVVRSIDFIASREKAQQANIFMTGGSQGGAFTIAGAALDDRLNAIAPSIQFMGDFPNYFEVAAWPASVARQKQSELGMSDEEMYAFLSYFDTKNLATLVTCPMTTAIGLQDPVCPPRTNFAPFITCPSAEKVYTVNPEYQHGTPAEWWTTYFDFFKAHLKQDTPTAITLPTDNGDDTAMDRAYTIGGTPAADGYKGIVVENGKKYVRQ